VLEGAKINNTNNAIGSAGALAEMAATSKSAKYGALGSHYCLQSIALECLGPMNCDARQFLLDLGRTRRISHSSGNDRVTFFLFQRIHYIVS